MRLKDEFVIFHLSAEGREAFKGFFSGDSVSGYVVDTDELGVWLWVSAQRPSTRLTKGDVAQELVPVILLKRQYFSHAEFDVDPNSLLGSQYVDMDLS